MKVKSGFILHKIGNENVVVPVEERTAEFQGMIRLNDSGAFLWKQMENECTEQSLAHALVEEYGIDHGRAKEAVAAFLAQISDSGAIAL